MSKSTLNSMTTRWLGVGIGACLAAVTLGLVLTDQLHLYINPSQTWFALSMSLILLVGAALSFLLPLGAENDHGHDHGEDDAHGNEHRPAFIPRPVRVIGIASAAVAASAVAAAAVVLPPQPLSVEVSMDRDTGTPPLFAGQDVVALASSGDTGEFGVGEWAATFATTTRPESFAGEPVQLAGFVMPDEDSPEDMKLGRLVITHCVIDAQPASVSVTMPAWDGVYEVGQWIEVDGNIVVDASGALTVDPETITAIDAPADPYEY